MTRHTALIIAGILLSTLLSTGCTKVASGNCDPADPNLEWYFIHESNGIMSIDKCVLCDNSVAESDYASWATDHAQGEEGAPGDATPCLYVYGTAANPANTASLCAQMICNQNPNTNDGVKKTHGAWNDVKDKIGDAGIMPEQTFMTLEDDGALDVTGAVSAPVFAENAVVEGVGFEAMLDPAFYGASGTDTRVD
jgi:hypothetical protein